MKNLREKFVKEMEVRRFSASTKKSYLLAVRGLAGYYLESPEKISRNKLKDYVHYLLETRKLNWSTVNGVVSGLKFFYAEVLNRQEDVLAIPARKTPRQLPEILSAEEVKRLFDSADNQKHRVFLMTTYAGGFRVSEAVRLKLTDIDSQRMMIRIEKGKREKDRYTILSSRLLGELREYWKKYHPPTWLFPSSTGDSHIANTTARAIFQNAKKRAGITKKGGIHSLRHGFATHMLEAGVDTRTIQILMGHSSIQSTCLYLKVTRKKLGKIKSPLDLLDVPQQSSK